MYPIVLFRSTLEPVCAISFLPLLTKNEKGQGMWCYETEGLLAKNQEEVVVLLEHEPTDGKSYPKDILTVLSLVYDCACKGMLVRDGGYTQLGGTLLGSQTNAGFVYTKWRTQVRSFNQPPTKQI